MISSVLIFDGFATGSPKGQPRPRAFSRGGKAAVYDPGTAEGWKACVAQAMEPLSGRLLECPLKVRLTFFFPRPKGHFGKRGLLPSAPRELYDKKPDADNAAKALIDAATIIQVWRDDDQICDLMIRKRWAAPAALAGCQIEIFQLTES